VVRRYGFEPHSGTVYIRAPPPSGEAFRFLVASRATSHSPSFMIGSAPGGDMRTLLVVLIVEGSAGYVHHVLVPKQSDLVYEADPYAWDKAQMVAKLLGDNKPQKRSIVASADEAKKEELRKLCDDEYMDLAFISQKAHDLQVLATSSQLAPQT
jgi:hypothetical protein